MGNRATENKPAPMAHSYRLGLVTWRYQVRIPVGPDICHRGCAYTVLQTVQRPGVYSAAYGTVHYREPLKSLEIRVGHSPGFGLPSVVIMPWLCRKRRKAIFIHSFTANNLQNAGETHLPLASIMRVLPQEPGRIEYYNQLFCLCGHLGGVSELQTAFDVSYL